MRYISRKGRTSFAVEIVGHVCERRRAVYETIMRSVCAFVGGHVWLGWDVCGWVQVEGDDLTCL